MQDHAKKPGSACDAVSGNTFLHRYQKPDAKQINGKNAAGQRRASVDKPCLQRDASLFKKPWFREAKVERV
jgi:hypothetical protein